MLVAKPLLLPLLLALRLRKLGCIQAKVGDRLPVELTRRLQLLAVLELLHGTRGFVAPASICRPALKPSLSSACWTCFTSPRDMLWGEMGWEFSADCCRPFCWLSALCWFC